ncbi:MAG: hypothetical protein ABI837_18455 [Acidobacteriota bacterium]
MRRKPFDLLISVVGAVMVVVLVVAGALALVAYRFADSNVHDQLEQQQIFFPEKGSDQLSSEQIGPYLNKYAGQQVLTGQQAKAYADHYIAVHLSEMPLGGVYSKVSAASRANPSDTALAAEVQSSFQGTTLRGLLLEAYAFSTFGQIALWSAIASFILAGVMAVLVALGVWHARRVSEDAELLPRRPGNAPTATAAGGANVH